jgi:hypothetical protein
VTSASLLLLAVLAGWGPVWPAPDATPSDAAVPPTETPTPAPEAPKAVKTPATAAAPTRAIIARGPLDVRARPALVAAPRPAPAPSKPLHKQWAFWAIAGGFFVGAVTAVVIATRPAPEPYRGNAPPYYVSWP